MKFARFISLAALVTVPFGPERAAVSAAEPDSGAAAGTILDALRRDRDGAGIPGIDKSGPVNVAAIDPVYDAIVAWYITSLADSDAEVRANAATELGRLFPRPKAATDALTAALADADPFVRWKAAWALGQIVSLSDNKPATVQALVRLSVQDPSEGVRAAALEALRFIGGRP